MKQYTVETRDRDDKYFSVHCSYSYEESASEKARELYHRGVYSVRVLKPDGTESTDWCKPKYAPKIGVKNEKI